MREVGVTATRKGLTPAQLRAALKWLTTRPPGRLHHGDCVGGDEQLDGLAHVAGWVVRVHPPDNPKLRAFVTLLPGDSSAEPKGYIARDDEILDETEILLAFPKEDAEPKPARGQGTWTVVRHARKRGIPFIIFWPDGHATIRPPKPLTSS